MTRTTLGLFGFLLLSSVSCNSALLGDNGPASCPEGQVCPDPNNPGGQTSPEMVTKVGGNGSGGTPFDPNGGGSGGIVLDPSGNVVLDPRGGSAMAQSVLWVANSGDGTVSKIDARSMKQLARYVTFPGGNGDPSRTTVSLNGDVVVANRAWVNGANGTQASAVYIAGDLSGCVDRNGNGKIDTHLGEDITVPAAYQWAAGRPASPDECVVWITDLSKDKNGTPVGGVGPRPRAAGFDSNLKEPKLSKYVYIGLFDTSEVIRLDSKTGAIVTRIPVGPTQPYGLALDRNGKVWVMGRETEPGTLTSIDPTRGDAVKSYPGATASNGQPCNYGITADARGYIYTSWMQCAARFNPTTEKFDTLVIASAGRLRGLGVDNNNQLYIADDQLGMHHVDATPAPPAAGGASTMVAKKLVRTAVNNVGVAIDFDNKPWVVSTDNVATRVDVANNYATLTQTGVRGSYTYSDMSGYQLRNASRAGTYRNIFPGCAVGVTTWTKLTYTLQAPAGTTASIRYRGAPTQAELVNATWVAATGPSPVSIALPSGLKANFLQVEVNMTAVDPNVTPVLSALAAGYTCMVIIG
jgi:hypothetical protein